jgi:hypothetical protein
VKPVIAQLKDWKIFAARYRGPLDAFLSIVRTITAPTFFRMSQ